MINKLYKSLLLIIMAISLPTFASTKKCYITFSSKGGTGTMEKQECLKGSTVKLNPCTFTKDEYYFKCWEDDFGKTYKDQDFILVDTDKHLHATWSKSGDANDPVITVNNQDEKIIEEIVNYQKLRNLDYTIYPNKWYTVGTDKWYYIGTDLKPKRGWHEEVKDNYVKDNKSRWFYLDPNTCLLSLGWKVIDRNYYYFATESIEADYIFDKVSGNFVPNGKDKELGQMYCDEYTPDGRYVNSLGVMVNQYR